MMLVSSKASAISECTPIEASTDIELTTTGDFGDPAIEKITNVAQKVYGADAIVLGERAKERQMMGTNETMYVETQVAG
jgi:formyltetrahydrofolate synthetase